MKRNLERHLPQEASHLSRSMSKGFEMLRAGIQWDIDERPRWSLEEDGKSFLHQHISMVGHGKYARRKLLSGIRFGTTKDI